MARYDRIGHCYAHHRREDPELSKRIAAALSDAQTVVNVGAGAGSYEPDGAHVLAIEPSAVMAKQRPPSRPAIRATAQALPLHDQSVDAAMTVLSMHHWHPDQRLGVEEMCRVARHTVVMVTIDPEVSGEMWLMRDYLTEVRDLDLEIFPRVEAVVSWLDRPATVDVIPTPRDTPDHNLLSFWGHPERVLDPNARAATSGFARQTDAVVGRVVDAVRSDLDSGRWDARYGALRELDALDCGLRLIRAWRDG
ncbi:MAG: class I SAM-dependent methyltransferase [Myxococcota bacterium]